MKQEISKFPSFNHSGKEHIINTFTSKECDKSAENKDVKSKGRCRDDNGTGWEPSC